MKLNYIDRNILEYMQNLKDSETKPQADGAADPRQEAAHASLQIFFLCFLFSFCFPSHVFWAFLFCFYFSFLLPFTKFFNFFYLPLQSPSLSQLHSETRQFLLEPSLLCWGLVRLRIVRLGLIRVVFVRVVFVRVVFVRFGFVRLVVVRLGMVWLGVDRVGMVRRLSRCLRWTLCLCGKSYMGEDSGGASYLHCICCDMTTASLKCVKMHNFTLFIETMRSYIL